MNAMMTIDTLSAALTLSARELDAARAAYYAAPSDETLAAWDSAALAHESALAQYTVAVDALRAALA